MIIFYIKPYVIHTPVNINYFKKLYNCINWFTFKMSCVNLSLWMKKILTSIKFSSCLFLFSQLVTKWMLICTLKESYSTPYSKSRHMQWKLLHLNIIYFDDATLNLSKLSWIMKSTEDSKTYRYTPFLYQICVRF